MGFWTLSIIIACLASLMFNVTWTIIGKLLVFSIHILKWAIVAGLLFGLANSTMAYKKFGWTPLVGLFGRRIYGQ